MGRPKMIAPKLRLWTAFFVLGNREKTRYSAQFCAESREDARKMAAKSHHNSRAVTQIIVKRVKRAWEI